MFAKGPMPGATPKADAMALLPPGTKCVRYHEKNCYVILLPNGRSIADGNNANKAWEGAAEWARQKEYESTYGGTKP